MTTSTLPADQVPLPGAALPVDRMPGHWLLARLGKRVLRPGGVELTQLLLSGLAIGPDDDVAEMAPGFGATTRLVLAALPRSYVGVERDAAAVEQVRRILRGNEQRVVQGSASDTGLPDAAVDVAFGEAYLTMQPASQKARILAELARIVRPGGRVGLHEVAFSTDTLEEAQTSRVRDELTDSIKVHVSPLSVAAWRALLDSHGFDVVQEHHRPLNLLEPARLVRDEGVLPAARFACRVVRDRAARRRVVAMRKAMHGKAQHLEACALVAVRRA